MRVTTKLAAIGTTAAAFLLAACGGGGGNPLAETSSSPSGSAGGGGGAVVVGSANFTENQILAELYAQAMKAKGVDASTKLN
ncbi:MAG TPA: glycine betaine ABC transporter substrate-binding protein, partial [Microlunatus sp.]